MLVLAAGCGSAPSPASPSPTPTGPTRPSVTLWLHAAIDGCHSIGGCDATVAIAPAGQPAPERFTHISGIAHGRFGGRPPTVQGLPGRIEPGRWTVWLRHLAVSDAYLNGVPLQTFTIAECEVTFEVAAGQTVRVEARFGEKSCSASAEIEGG